MDSQAASNYSQQEDNGFCEKSSKDKKLPLVKTANNNDIFNEKKVKPNVKSRSQNETSHGSMRNSQQILNKQEIEQYIGMLESKWTNQSNQTIAICFGTAVVIAQNVILTCAHNIFSQLNRMVCDQVKFIPGKAKSSDFRREDTFTATCRYIAYEKLGFFERYSQKPLPKDFALILLNRQLPFQKFLSLTSRELRQGQSIEIIGYPRKRQQRSAFERVDLEGEVIETRAHIIVHNMKTESGHSGSPILCRTKVENGWKYEICGLHSHKGPLDYNRGVAITAEIKLKIDEMISTLRAKQSKQ